MDCAEFEIPTMVIHLPDDKHTISELGPDRVKRIAEKSEKLGINVAFENLRNFVNLKYVLDKINSSRIGFCYDSCHHNNYNADVDLLSMYGSRLMALHLHDNGGIYDQHQIPFDGRINWVKTINSISNTGYSGATAIEAMNWDYENLSVGEFLQLAFERGKRLEELKIHTL